MATLCSSSALSCTHVHTQTSHCHAFWWQMGQVTLLPARVKAELCLPWLSVSSNNPLGWFQCLEEVVRLCPILNLVWFNTMFFFLAGVYIHN